MAAEPPAPAAPPSTAPGYNPAPPPAPAPAARRRGCGCGGCLLSLLAVLALAGVAIWWFAIRPATAAAPAPAVLTVYVAQVQVGRGGSGYAPGRTGEQLSAGRSVRTDAAGRASLQFPDGSITRLAGSTELTLSEETLTAAGGLNRVTLDQAAGRTFSSVQKLAPGSNGFSVRGRHVDSEVRGTEFEVFVRPDGSTLVKLFAGRLQVSGASGSVTLTSGQQVAISAAGGLGAPSPIAAEPGDPFLTWVGPTGSETAALSGNQPGTAQSMPSSALVAAVNTPVDTPGYEFPGGDLTAALSYPGSRMKLEVIGPDGRVVASSQGPPPIRVTVPGAPAGVYRGRVTALLLDHGPEAWTVTFAANPPCHLPDPNAPAPAPGTPVRQVLSDTQINAAVQQSGLVAAAVHINPAPGGAIVSGSIRVGAASLAGTAVVFAATPGIGVTIAHVTLDGIPITSQVAEQLTRLQGTDLGSVGTGFVVERVYSCRGADGGLLVIEGRSASGA